LPKKTSSKVARFFKLRLPFIYGRFAQLVFGQLRSRPENILSVFPVGRVWQIVVNLGQVVCPGLCALRKFVAPDNWMSVVDETLLVVLRDTDCFEVFGGCNFKSTTFKPSNYRNELLLGTQIAKL
jgi:hypothetical protein